MNSDRERGQRDGIHHHAPGCNRTDVHGVPDACKREPDEVAMDEELAEDEVDNGKRCNMSPCVCGHPEDCRPVPSEPDEVERGQRERDRRVLDEHTEAVRESYRVREPDEVERGQHETEGQRLDALADAIHERARMSEPGEVERRTRYQISETCHSEPDEVERALIEIKRWCLVPIPGSFDARATRKILVGLSRAAHQRGKRDATERAEKDAPVLARLAHSLIHQECTCDSQPDNTCWYHLSDMQQIKELANALAAAIRRGDTGP